MQARRKLAPGQKGTKKFLARYGDQLVCVRYRYDEQRRKRFTTVEIIVEEAAWVPPSRPDKAALVGVRIGLRETDLQRRARQAGGKWNPAKQVWEMRYDQALAQGLKERIVDAEGV
jgi:hypothetical protein